MINTGVTHAGMGAIPHSEGTAFRVWAPHAEKVTVAGTFNDWNEDAIPLEHESQGYWYVNVEQAKKGGEYRFYIHKDGKKLSRIDPYAREVTNSVGNGVIHDTSFDWGDDAFQTPPLNEIVIYEMHIGTFGVANGDGPANFEDAIARLDHLARLGVNMIELMPVAEFPGDVSWGYNPSHPFAIESAYGGSGGLKRFVLEAHRRGLGVIQDVVYNHFGPTDLDLWRFDGWYENEGGGIYFYNDWRAETPWGATRPDYGRAEVRRYILDNAMMWVEEYRMDGLRFDASLYIRRVRGTEDPDSDLPDGWTLVQWLNKEIKEKYPAKITIAEDLQDNEWLTKPEKDGGAGFNAQWCSRFVHPVRQSVITASDEHRSMDHLRDTLSHTFNGDPFQRVIYSESHDEVANGKSRVPQEINPGDPKGWYAQKRSILGAALTFTAPGVPMIFQGQEFLENGYFQDTVPLDWDQSSEFRGIIRLYRDLIGLRLNRQGFSRGLTGSNIEFTAIDDERNILVYRRWHSGGPGDEVVVALNFSQQAITGLPIGFPSPGMWRLRLNSDWEGYSKIFGSEAHDVEAKAGDKGTGALIDLPGYSLLIFSQDPE